MPLFHRETKTIYIDAKVMSETYEWPVGCVVYAAARAFDDADNPSTLSVPAAVGVPDLIPPGPVTDLSLSHLTGSAELVLYFTASGDDGDRGTGEFILFSFSTILQSI